MILGLEHPLQLLLMGLGEGVRVYTLSPLPQRNHPSNLSSYTFMAQKRPHMVHWSSLAWERSR